MSEAPSSSQVAAGNQNSLAVKVFSSDDIPAVVVIRVNASVYFHVIVLHNSSTRNPIKVMLIAHQIKENSICCISSAITAITSKT